MARTGTAVQTTAALNRFAERLAGTIGATKVLLFGSRARGTARSDSDYDLIVVAPTFEGVNLLDRGLGLRALFYEVGGHAPMDLICLTPDEFDEASRHIIRWTPSSRQSDGRS
jgi:predicted nucleotidyltransferase